MLYLFISLFLCILLNEFRAIQTKEELGRKYNALKELTTKTEKELQEIEKQITDATNRVTLRERRRMKEERVQKRR
jgi:hypothetical protein